MNFYRGLPFGQVREDPTVELFVADRVENLERGLIIASAGCTAFSLATRPAHWTILDGNPEQLHLCRLKRALLLECDRSEILEALQTDAVPAFRRVEKQLPPETRAYWSQRRGALNHCGRVDRMLDSVAWLYRSLLRRPGQVQAFFELDNLESQRRTFESRWQGRLWRTCFRLAMATPVLRWVYGPLVDAFPSGFSEVFRGQVETALCNYPAATNLYLWQLFLGRYPPGRAPYYLEHLETLRPRLAALEFCLSPVGEWLDSQKGLDFMGLSNVLEVSDDEETARLCQSVARAGRSGALVVLRRIIPQSHRRGAERHLIYRDDLTQSAAPLETGCFCRTVEVFQVP